MKTRLYSGEAWWMGVEVRLSIRKYALIRLECALRQPKSQKPLAEERARMVWRTSLGSHGRLSFSRDGPRFFTSIFNLSFTRFNSFDYNHWKLD